MPDNEDILQSGTDSNPDTEECGEIPHDPKIFDPAGEKLKFIVRQGTGVVKGGFSVHVFSAANAEIETPISYKKLEEPMIYRKTIQTPPGELADARIVLLSSFYFVDAMVRECRISLEVFQGEETIFFLEKTKPLTELLKMEHIVIQCKPGEA